MHCFSIFIYHYGIQHHVLFSQVVHTNFWFCLIPRQYLYDLRMELDVYKIHVPKLTVCAFSAEYVTLSYWKDHEICIE
jgi:hypothetical protein